ncbi:MAG: nicotinamide-nucleotide amidohydrolase family protein [Oligoflexia bacterium]|nr:nicotinamide-nucleotide amidohydrolase family protein [Oligoflexia bacterium]
MKIALIAIGDELLNGRTLEKNGHWLAGFLYENGILLNDITIIRDDEEVLEETFKKSFECNDFTIVTGGLGPTLDDKTKSIIGKVFGGPLKESAKAIEIVSKQYENYSRQWHRESNSYHMIPEKVEPIFNPIGLAPGLKFVDSSREKYIFCAPGVPREFFGMFEKEIYPFIKSHSNFPNETLRQVTVRTRGVPEEEIFYRRCPGLWEKLSEFGQVASLPQIMGIDILVKFYANEEEYKKKRDSISAIMKSCAIAENIWSWEEGNLEEFVVKEATAKNLTIAFAESCTGGLTANRITNVSGASQVFLASYVTYANEAKINALKVLPKTIEEYGAVSIETAKEMAAGARKSAHSDIAISFTGIAGPGGGSKEKPVGTVAIGWSTKESNDAKLYHFKGDRELLKQRFSEAGLFKLLNLIRSSETN